MLKTTVIHPELLRALAEAGHGARILVTDANYPATLKAPPAARTVFLNFTPGLVGAVDIVRGLAGVIPVESALYMSPPDGTVPAIVAEYRDILGPGVSFDSLDRFAFYKEAANMETLLVIVSGETRTYANLLMTVGVVA